VDGRIGSLEVRYRTRGIDPVLAARLPALTRAIEQQLGDALDARLSATIGDGRDVYVVRQLHAHAVIDDEAWQLDRPVVDRMSEVSAAALAAVLAQPSDDVVRFADQADFLCAFIVDELDGRAEGQWYFGAFRRFRQADSAATIDAALAAHAEELAAVLGRLARRGRLDDLLARIGADRLLAIGGGARASSSSAPDVAVLVATALDLLARLGWTVGDGVRRTLVQALMRCGHPAAPEWTDRRQLSAFVWSCVEAASGMLLARGATRGWFDRSGLEHHVRSGLDWLDGPWLLERIGGDDGHDVSASAARPPDALALVLGRIAQQVMAGHVSVGPDEDIDVIVVRLIAAAQLQAHEAVPVADLRAALAVTVGAWRQKTVSQPGSALEPGPERTTDTTATRGRDRQRASRGIGAARSDAAETLSKALVERSTATSDEGEPTAGASLYLLSRAVLDGGLPGLATAHGVPLGALLAGLAVSWLRLEWPLDGPAHDWTGAASREDTTPAVLDEAAPRLTALAEALRARLRDQGLTGIEAVGTGDSSADAPAGTPPWSPGVAATLDEIARPLLRSWGRWLPGLKEASARFLLSQCLRRGGAVRVSDSHIAVTLDPAPLDVVLQMAGYLQPIAALPWRDGRAASFTVRRRPTA
jgi:hypothetical protein